MKLSTVAAVWHGILILYLVGMATNLFDPTFFCRAAHRIAFFKIADFVRTFIFPKIRVLWQHKTAFLLLILGLMNWIGLVFSWPAAFEMASLPGVSIGSRAFGRPQQFNSFHGTCRFRDGRTKEFEHSIELMSGISRSLIFKDLYVQLLLEEDPFRIPAVLHQQFCNTPGAFARRVGCDGEVAEVAYRLNVALTNKNLDWTIKCDR